MRHSMRRTSILATLVVAVISTAAVRAEEAPADTTKAANPVPLVSDAAAAPATTPAPTAAPAVPRSTAPPWRCTTRCCA